MTMTGPCDSDDDLQRAIALSLQYGKDEADEDDTVDESDVEIEIDAHGKTICPTMATCGQGDDSKITTVLRQTSSILGLDRKTMEQDRLARKAAKSRGVDARNVTSKRKTDISPPPSKRARKEIETAQVKEHGSLELRFPRGVIKRTGLPTPGDATGIKIEEIIDKEHVNIAVLSTFLIDADWIISKFDKLRTKFYMVLHANRQVDRDMYEADFEGQPNVKLCLPKLGNTFATMHSKLMLLFFDRFLRVVIPTANLTDFDWGERGDMENSVFLIDLPRLLEGVRRVENLPLFGQELHRFLSAQGLQKQALDALLKFDFQKTEKLAFIHTSAGSHYGQDMDHTGLTGLSQAVRQLGLSTKSPIQLDIATSSLGSLNDNMINTIYEAARGKDIVKHRDQLKGPSATVKNNSRIYFPTHNTVRNSHARSAGTICLQRHYFEKADFPRQLLRDYVSTRQGLLSHNKIFLVRGQQKAWAYVGSANLSESAWGRIVMDRTRKEAKLNCTNWECGVLVPAGDDDDEMRARGGSEQADIHHVFGEVMDVPFVCGEDQENELKYNGKLPWFFKEND